MKPYHPTAADLRVTFRAVWAAWLLERDHSLRWVLADTMDHVRIQLVQDNAAAWTKFMRTVPGFAEFWAAPMETVTRRYR